MPMSTRIRATSAADAPSPMMRALALQLHASSGDPVPARMVRSMRAVARAGEQQRDGLLGHGGVAVSP